MMYDSLSEVLEHINNIVCLKNEKDMFVPVWFGSSVA